MYSMKRKIVVDSSSNLSRLPGADFACVPLKIITAEREYVDDESTDAFTMARELRTYKGKSSTSCPNVGDFLAAYAGADEIFVVTITGTLSGCCNAARMAAEEYQDARPGAKVFVLDSLSTGPEMCLLARRLADLAATDATFEEICEAAAAYAAHTHLLFSLESLNNLARNGRVKLTAAVVARALGIRPSEAPDLSSFVDGDSAAAFNQKRCHVFRSQASQELLPGGPASGKINRFPCAAPDTLPGQFQTFRMPGNNNAPRSLQNPSRLLRPDRERRRIRTEGFRPAENGISPAPEFLHAASGTGRGDPA